MTRFSTTNEQRQEFVNNIMATYNRATTEEKVAGAGWYKEAWSACSDMSKRFDVPLAVITGVVAALSPNNRWERNLGDAERLIAAYLNGDDVLSVSVSTYNAMRAKGWKICAIASEQHQHATADQLNEAILEELRGQKIKSFYSNIMGLPGCTIDGHARNIAYNERLALTGGKFTLGKVEYVVLQEMYQEAAAIVSADLGVELQASVMQAITWVTWRRIHKI